MEHLKVVKGRSHSKCSDKKEQKQNTNKYKATFGGEGYANCGGVFTEVFTSPNSSNCIHYTCANFCISIIP